MSMNTVAFFTNKSILPGLHSTILSLLESLSDESPLLLKVYAENISDKEKKLLEATHAKCPRGTTLDIEDFTIGDVGGAKPLHGTMLTYGRIFLGSLLPDTSLCLYLDCDLIIKTPVNEMFDLFDDQHTAFAIEVKSRQTSLDADLYRDVGLDMDGDYFNAGVLGMNLDLWRERGLYEECERTISTYLDRINSEDETIMNIVLGHDFKRVDKRFNIRTYPEYPKFPEPVEPGIYHLIGAPKPWDVFGSRMHDNYNIWADVHERTAIARVPLWRYRSMKRTILISRKMYNSWRIRRKRED